MSARTVARLAVGIDTRATREVFRDSARCASRTDSQCRMTTRAQTRAYTVFSIGERVPRKGSGVESKPIPTGGQR